MTLLTKYHLHKDKLYFVYAETYGYKIYNTMSQRPTNFFFSIIKFSITFMEIFKKYNCMQNNNIQHNDTPSDQKLVNPLMPNGLFNICCPRDCVSRHNGGTSGAPLKPLRDDSALRALSSLRGLRGVVR